MAKFTAEERRKYAVLSGDRFPIRDSESAVNALDLRGHTRTKAERRKVIRAAARYAPQAARRAWEKDRKEGLV